MTTYVEICEKGLVAHNYGCRCALCAETKAAGILHHVAIYKKAGKGWTEMEDVYGGNCGIAHERAYALCRLRGWRISGVSSFCHRCHGYGNVKAGETRCRLRCPECDGSGCATVPPVPADLATKKLQRALAGEGS